MTSDATSTSAAPAGEFELAPKVAAALRRYRFMAFVVGIALLILVAIMVAKYGFDVRANIMAAWGPIHGVFYAIYVVVAFDLSQKARWKLSNLLLVLLAGCVPIMSFFVESWVNRSMQAGKRL